MINFDDMPREFWRDYKEPKVGHDGKCEIIEERKTNGHQTIKAIKR
jgi:hypothetical protein